MTGLFIVVLALALASTTESQDLVLTNARVIDGLGEVHESATVVVKDGRIVDVGSGEDSVGAEVIDVGGASVLPGLIDAHVHFSNFQAIVDDSTCAVFMAEELPGILRGYLNHGITTVKNIGDLTDAMVDVRQQLRGGHLEGPRLLIVGPTITSVGGHPAASMFHDNPWFRAHQTVEVDTEEQGRDAVRALAALGVDAIKVIAEGGRDPSHPHIHAMGKPITMLSASVLSAVMAEAKAQELLVTVHVRRLAEAVEVVAAGADGLEHGVQSELLEDNELATLMVDQDAVYVATLQVVELFAPDELATPLANLKSLAEHGVRIVMGSDTFYPMPPGEKSIREMELMVQAGLTPAQVIESATREAAAALGLESELGTLEQGKLADFIVVDGDPLQDISVLRDLLLVVQAGRVVVDNTD